MRILVLRGGALGDFLVTLPALRALRQMWPSAHIELIGNAIAADLGRLTGDLDAVHSQHSARWAPLYGDNPLEGELREWLNGFDVIVSFWPDPDGTLATRLGESAAKLVLSHGNATTSPAAKHFCDALEPLGVVTDHYESTLPLAADKLPRIPENVCARDYIVIHPGSGSPAKTWLLSNWIQLMQRMNLPTVVVLGEAESTISFGVGEEGDLTCVRNPSVPALVSLLRPARLYVGHDTGVSHLAAALGVPCVLLFGPTQPHVWAPPGLAVRVIKNGPTLADISVDDARKALKPYGVNSGVSLAGVDNPD